MNWMVTLTIIFMLGAIIFFYVKSRQSRQLAYIRSYVFHQSIKDKLKQKYPHLNNEQTHLVFRALRDYFWMNNHARRSMVSMPSQVVDETWHEFILFTRAYKTFCQKSLGRFLHHVPAAAMATPTQAQTGIKRAWRLACAREKINPASPTRLPLIFAIDSMLEIPNGFTYTLNCKDRTSTHYGDAYCGGDIGCSSGCAGESGASSESGGFFDSLFGSDGCSSGCGGGCGGD